jgi:hypothetical protein
MSATKKTFELSYRDAIILEGHVDGELRWRLSQFIKESEDEAIPKDMFPATAEIAREGMRGGCLFVNEKKIERCQICKRLGPFTNKRNPVKREKILHGYTYSRISLSVMPLGSFCQKCNEDYGIINKLLELSQKLGFKITVKSWPLTRRILEKN